MLFWYNVGMENTTIYLIRHGEVDNPSGMHYGRTRNIGLSHEGVMQMQTLGRLMEQRGDIPVVLYASPLYRTQLSARHLFPNIPIITDEDLLETYSEGLDGKSIKEASEILNGDSFPEGVIIENPLIMAERVIRAINRSQAEYPGQTAALISHGDPITYALYKLLNPSLEFPNRAELKRTTFVKKGTGRRFVIDQEGRILTHELVQGDMGHVSRERER